MGDDMPVLKNQKHERFAVFVAQGSTLDEAYKQAGYKENRHNAWSLAQKPHVAERIVQVKTEITAAAALFLSPKANSAVQIKSGPASGAAKFGPLSMLILTRMRCD